MDIYSVNVTWSINTLNRWSKSKLDSPTLCLISFSSIIHYDSDLGFLNSLKRATWISPRVLALPSKNFMYQFNARSLKVVTIWLAFMSESVTFLTLHTTSHKNQCCWGSSDPVPWNNESLISLPAIGWFVVVPELIAGFATFPFYVSRLILLPDSVVVSVLVLGAFTCSRVLNHSGQLIHSVSSL